MTMYTNPVTGAEQSIDFLGREGSATPTWFVPRKDVRAIIGYNHLDDMEPVSSFGVWENEHYLILTSNAQSPTPASFIYLITSPSWSSDTFYLQKLFGYGGDPFWVRWFRGGVVEETLENAIACSALHWAYKEWGTEKGFPGKQCLEHIMLKLAGEDPLSHMRLLFLEDLLTQLMLAQGKTFANYLEQRGYGSIETVKESPYTVIESIRAFHIHAASLSMKGALVQRSYPEYGDDEFKALVIDTMPEHLLSRLEIKGNSPGRAFRRGGAGWSDVAVKSCWQARIRWSSFGLEDCPLEGDKAQIFKALYENKHA